MTKKTELITDIFDEIEGSDQAINIWGSNYLPVQWQNILGQWECPLEHWGGSMLEFEYEISEVRHQANVVPGFLLDSINIAPFAMKIHWGYKDSDGKYVSDNQPDWTVSDAWRSRVHVLALMKEAPDTPVIITAGSNTGKHMLANMKQGQRRIANMLKRINRPRVPPHFFWMEMIAGKPVLVGEGETQQTICPPIAVAPTDMHKMTTKSIARYLTDLYVGSDIRDVFEGGLFDEGQEWSIRQPEQLQIVSGDSENVALPPVSIEAQVLDGDVLWLPDLSEHSQTDMKACAKSIPGLFDSQIHINRAFAKVMNNKRLGGAERDVQWEAWRVEIEKRWAEKLTLLEEQARAAQLR